MAAPDSLAVAVCPVWVVAAWPVVVDWFIVLLDLA
jgi:hypothetical protein